jgi:hypothetical protein
MAGTVPAAIRAIPASNSRADIGTYLESPRGTSARRPAGTWTRTNSSGSAATSSAATAPRGSAPQTAAAMTAAEAA